MALRNRRRVLAAAAEGTAGTAETLSASDAAFNVYDTEFSFDVPLIRRSGQSAFSNLTGVAGPRMCTFRFACDLTGDGSAGNPSWASTFLPACGMAYTASGQVYAFDTGSTDTLTIGAYIDGVKRVGVGCMGTFTIELRNGEPGRVNFEFVGKYGGNTDVALIAPTYPTVDPPRFASATFTIGGYTPLASRLSIASNNEVVMRADATDATGYLSAYITGRQAGGSTDPEDQLVATFDAYGDQLASTEAALSCIVGSANNRITMAAPKLQFTNVGEGDRDGLMTTEIDFDLNRSASAGDDEFTIAFD